MSLALDEALARQAEIIAELRAERDDALRRVDRLNGTLASQKQQLEAAQRQRDQLASRLAAMLRIELDKEKRAGSPPERAGAARSHGDASSRAGTPPASAGRPRSAPPKRVVLKEGEREEIRRRLLKQPTVKEKAKRLSELDEKVYGEMDKKKKGKPLKDQKAFDDNVKKLYTTQIEQRKKREDELAKMRKEEVNSKLKEGRELLEKARQRRIQALEAEGRRVQPVGDRQQVDYAEDDI